MPEKTTKSLLEQKTALGSYLDDMLHHATETAALAESETVVATDEIILPGSLILDIAEEESSEVVTQIEHIPADEPLRSVDSDNVVELEKVTETAENLSTITVEMFPIQCLMFKVGGNLLSIPLTDLHSVVKWQTRLTQLPGEPDWMLGILKHRDNNVRVVDSASILQINRTADNLPGFVLVLGDEKWGITCDQIDKVITLNYDDVKWNQNQTNRIALGTIRSSLSSLLSPQGIVNCLSNGRFCE